jgi:hypothetical protein
MRAHIRTDFGVAIAVMLAGASLAACGGQSDTQFNASFDKQLHDSCMTSFTEKGGPPDKAEPYCACVVKEADKLSTQDKMTLALHQDKMTAMAQTCVAQITGQAPPSNAP